MSSEFFKNSDDSGILMEFFKNFDQNSNRKTKFLPIGKVDEFQSLKFFFKKSQIRMTILQEF